MEKNAARELESVFEKLSAVENRPFNGFKILVFVCVAKGMNLDKIASWLHENSPMHTTKEMKLCAQLFLSEVSRGERLFIKHGRGDKATFKLTPLGMLLYDLIKRYFKLG